MWRSSACEIVSIWARRHISYYCSKRTIRPTYNIWRESTAGKYGEHEERFFSTNCIYLTWDRLDKTDLGEAETYDEIKSIVRTAFPEFGEHKLGNHSGQIWAFALGMKLGDLVAVPRKNDAGDRVRGDHRRVPPRSRGRRTLPT